MKTPMQELESRLIKIAIAKDGEVCGGVWNTISHLVSQMIDKEKQIIKDAFNEGYRQGENAAADITPVSIDVSCFGNAESYYEQTFGGSND